jgi:hypothetical protein
MRRSYQVASICPFYSAEVSLHWCCPAEVSQSYLSPLTSAKSIDYVSGITKLCEFVKGLLMEL